MISPFFSKKENYSKDCFVEHQVQRVPPKVLVVGIESASLRASISEIKEEEAASRVVGG